MRQASFFLRECRGGVGFRRTAEEDVGEARCSVGFAGKSSGSPCDIEKRLWVRWIGRRWTMAGDFTAEELSGGNGGGGGVSWLSARMGRNRGSSRGAVRERGSGECSARARSVSSGRGSSGVGPRRRCGAGEEEPASKGCGVYGRK